jgi:hypothetical protein
MMTNRAITTDKARNIRPRDRAPKHRKKTPRRPAKGPRRRRNECYTMHLNPPRRARLPKPQGLANAGKDTAAVKSP